MLHIIKTFFDYRFHRTPSDTVLQQATKTRYIGNASEQVSVWDDLQIIAHRGFSSRAPENTMAAIHKSLELPQLDMIEVDVHLSKDEQVIVIHDFSLDRTTDKKGQICDLSLEEIAKADAGTWFDQKYAGEKIPTLSEVLDQVVGKKKLLIEIKGKPSRTYPRIVPKIIAEIKKYQAEKWCIIQSFQPTYLEQLNQLHVDIEAHRLVSAPCSLPSVPKVSAINADYHFWSTQRISEVHQQKLKTFVYTVNDLCAIKKAILMGVDGIITNYPEKVIELKQKMIST